MEQKSTELQLIEKRLQKLELLLTEKGSELEKVKKENKRLHQSVDKIIKQLQINKNVTSRILQKMKMQESFNYEIKNEISTIMANIMATLRNRGQ